MSIWLPEAWIGLIAFSLMMYVILDGFTLGTGMIMPWLNRKERDICMSMILPTWDGNQTWLVLAMASLYGAFPKAFSILLPALYMPILLLVLSLLFRGICFEFRLKSKHGVNRWDVLFSLSSLFATFIQGLIVAMAVQGFGTDKPDFYISAFSIVTALALVIGYTALGAARTILKVEGLLRDKMYEISRYLCVALAVVLLGVLLFTPQFTIARQWDRIDIVYLLLIPSILAVLFAILFAQLLLKNRDYLPYWMLVSVFVVLYLGLASSLFPYVVPYQMTIFAAASPTNTLQFLIVGAAVMYPFLLLYTGYSYHVFRGKVTETLKY